MPNLRESSRRTALLLLAGTVVGASGCFSKSAAGTSQPTVLLLANNRGFYDVNVYAVRSGQTAGRRLGTVTGNASATIKVPMSELQPGNMLVVLVRSVGGRYTWYSPAVQMGSGIVARLDVVQTANGSLGQSQMYSQVVPQQESPMQPVPE
jgi:hypothetical protein